MERGDDDSIHQTVLDLKNSVSLSEYRGFLSTVYYFVLEFLKRDNEGSQQYRMCLNRSSTRFAVVAMQTEKADHLLRLLGFTATHESPDLMVMTDWQWSLPRLKTFCEVVVQELVVSKGDPTAQKPLPESTPMNVAIVYVAYHLHLRIQLLFRSTDDLLLSSMESQFLRSIEVVEQATCRLGILEQQGTVREAWNLMKSKLLQYIKAPSGGHNREDVSLEIRCMCRTMKYKLKAMISHDYYTLLPHFQNTQALLLSVKDGIMMTRDHVQVFIRNAVEVPHELFSDEYGRSLEELLSIMQRALMETLNISDIERAHNIAVWQSENVFTHLKKEEGQVGCGRRQNSQSMSFASVADRSSHADDRKQALREILGLLKSAVSYREFRMFLDVVHMGVEHLLYTQGAEPFRCINRAEPRFAAVAAQTDVAINLMYLLGYKEVPVESNSMIMDDYVSAKPTLMAFSELGHEELVVSRGDPIMTRPVIDIDHMPTLVAYLGYHFWLRCHLLVIHSVEHLLPVQEHDVLSSMTVVDEVTSKLSILRSDSPACYQWNSAKQSMVKYFSCLNRQGQRRHIHDSLCNVGNRIIFELGEMLPMDVVRLVFYAQNVEAVLGLTASGGMVDEKAVSTYLTCTGRLLDSLFSDEYMKTNQEIRGIFLRAGCHSLSDEDMDRVCLLSKWQSENFLSHLNTSALDGCGITPALLTMMSERQLDMSVAMGSQPVMAHEPHPTGSTVECLDNNSSDEEKVDVSEKPVNSDAPVQEEQLSSIPKDVLFMGAQKDNCVAHLLLELSDDSSVSCDRLLAQLSNLKGPAEVSLVRNRVAVVIEEKASQISKLEREISDIEAAVQETTADVVIETLQRELSLRQQQLQTLNRRISELQRVKLAFSTRYNISRRGQLMGLNVDGLQSFLNGCLCIYKHQTEGLAQLMACVVELCLFTDDELKQFFK